MRCEQKLARPALEYLEDRSTPATTVAVFPGTPGLWLQQGTRWVQITANTPSQVAVGAKGEVLADFDSQGLWYVARGACGWVQVTANDPDLIAIGSNGTPSTGINSDVFASFDGLGIWRAFRPSVSVPARWQWLTPTQPSQIDAGIRSLAADFDAQGLWTWNTTQGWYKASASDPTDIALTEYYYRMWLGGRPPTYTDTAGYTLAADFDRAGLWAMADSHHATNQPAVQPRFDGVSWRQRTGVNPSDMALDPEGRVLASFPGYGLQLVQWPWTRLTVEEVSDIAYSNDRILYGVFPDGILRMQVPGGAWQVLSYTRPVFYATA